MMGINTRRALMLGGLMAGFFFGFAGVMKESYAGYVVAQTGLSSLSTVFQPLAAVLPGPGSLQKHINIAIGIPISIISYRYDLQHSHSYGRSIGNLPRSSSWV